VVHGDAMRTAVASMAAEPRFRLAIVMDLVTIAGVVGLIAGLHVVLRPVDRYWALTALALRLVENCVWAAAVLGLFAFLVLLDGSAYLASLPTAQMQALAYAALRVHDASYAVGFTFLGLGSTVFAGLWLKSRYIPRAIAAWGVFSSLVMAIASTAVIVFPAVNGVLGMTYMFPLAIFEIGIGTWLLAYRLRDPSADRMARTL